MRFGQRRARRWVEKGELFRFAAPGGEVEHEARQVGGENFRPRIGLERRGLRLVPQPVANAGLGASGAAAALIGSRACDPHRFEAGDADIGLVARDAGQPAVDHDSHALDGDRGFRDRSREHDLAPAGRGGGDGAVLLVAGERAIKRDDIDGGIEPAFELRLRAADFRGAGQEHQRRAGIGAHRPRDGVGDLRLDRPGVAAEIAGLDRKRAAFAGDHRRFAEQCRDAGAVDCRRHHQQA